MRQCAHSLRGASGTIGAITAQQMANQVEQLAARADDLPALADASRQLRQHLGRLVETLKQRLG